MLGQSPRQYAGATVARFTHLLPADTQLAAALTDGAAEIGKRGRVGRIE